MTLDGCALCALCKSEIDDAKTEVSCTICKNAYHSKCVNIDLRGFHMKKNQWQCKTPLCIKQSQAKSMKGDDSDNILSHDVFFPMEDGRVDKKIFIYILKQKDDMILQLKSEIALLHKHINLLEFSKKDKSNREKPAAITKKPVITKSEAPVEVTATNQTKKKENKDRLRQSKQTANIPNPEEKVKATGLQSGNKIVNEPEVSTVVGKQKGAKGTITQSSRREKLIVGRRKDCDLKAAPKKAYLLVKRLSKNTTVDALKKYLMKDFPEVNCELLNNDFDTSNPRFKVCVDLENLEKIRDADIWPSGALITRFFHPSRERSRLT